MLETQWKWIKAASKKFYVPREKYLEIRHEDLKWLEWDDPWMLEIAENSDKPRDSINDSDDSDSSEDSGKSWVTTDSEDED